MAVISEKEAIEMSEVVNAFNQVEFLQERLAALELALEDVGWVRLTQNAAEEFSREGLRHICEIARVFYLKNPLIKRGVETQRDYVFGQGLSIKAEDERINKVIQAFLTDPKNVAELTGQQAMGYKEVDLSVEGNLFLVLFTSIIGGQVHVRSIPFDQIEDIICNPEDAKDPWYYKRAWSESRTDITTGQLSVETKTAYYPDLRYQPATRPALIGDKLVMWDAPVYHVRVGGMSHWKFGLSEVYAAIDWAKAYKEFLEDWATITRALSRFAWNLTTKGGKSAIAQAKTKLQTTVSLSGGETNPPPVAGSTFIGSENAALNPIRTAGATTSAEDGRRLLLMVASAVGLPESFFGDVSVGNLATAKSLDRPTELKMRSRQKLWADVFTDILGYVIRLSVGAGQLEAGAEQAVQIDFPPLLEHDVNASISAIVDAATLKGSQPASTIDEDTVTRLILTALGVDEVEAAAAKAAEEREIRKQEKAEMALAIAGQTQPQDNQPPARQVEEALLEVIRETAEALHGEE